MSTTNQFTEDQKQNSALTAEALLSKTLSSSIKGMYPVIVTDDIQETKQFYTALHYQIIFESTWFILLSAPGNGGSMIAFMNEVHPSSPPSPKASKGEGMFLTLDVEDATQLHQVMKSSGTVFSYDLTDEAWGQRRFALTDPNGIWIDIVEQVQPKEGWWDQYVVKQ